MSATLPFSLFSPLLPSHLSPLFFFLHDPSLFSLLPSFPISSSHLFPPFSLSSSSLFLSLSSPILFPPPPSLLALLQHYVQMKVDLLWDSHFPYVRDPLYLLWLGKGINVVVIRWPCDSHLYIMMYDKYIQSPNLLPARDG